MEAKPERLQKILAAAGLASRRKAEELIAAGLVSVNGHTVTEPGTKADPRLDEIRVDGKLLRGPERHVYLAMYKPKGYMTTVSDPEGRPIVMDLLKGVEERVFPVGRLDYMSEGLLLLTNDGDLMAQLTRAGSHLAKTYMVKVSGKPNDEALDKLRNGIMLPPEPGLAGARGKKQPGVERRSFAVLTQPATIQLAVDQENPWFEVTLTEGRNRQIRRMFEQVGHHIEKIKRIRYGSLTLDLEPGEFRHLTPKEVNQLRKSLDTPFKPKPIKVKSKSAPGARPERRAPVDAARFVKGRRGKPSADAPAPAPVAAARRPSYGPTRGPAAGTASGMGEAPARGTFKPREARPAAGRPTMGRGPVGAAPKRGFDGPRGPEFAGEKRRESGASTRGFPAKRKPPLRDDSEGRDKKREAPAGKGFGFEKFARPKFAKPGKDRQEGGAGGFGDRKPLGSRPFSERPSGDDRGAGAKPGGFSPARRWAKGPGKPEGRESRPESGVKRGTFGGGEGKARPGQRSSGFGKTFGKASGGRSAGSPPSRGGGDFSRPPSGSFKRPAGGAKRPGGGPSRRPSSPGGGTSRPPRRRPEE